MRDVTSLDKLAETAYSAVFSDICDALGRRSQTTAPGLRRFGGTGVLVGFARTFHSVRVEVASDPPYGAEIAFLDSLGPGDVVVGACSEPVAAWGELLSTAAIARGARGAVIAGCIRDAALIDRLGFPVFALGTRPNDCLGRISLQEVDQPLDLMGATVAKGDLIVADDDGVTAVPAEIAAEAMDRARRKAATETDARRLLLSGALLAEVWNTYKVL